MLRRPPRSTRTDTLFPYTTLFRSALLLCLALPLYVAAIYQSDWRFLMALLFAATVCLYAFLPTIMTVTQALVEPRMRASAAARSEEHTSELQSLMRISYAVFCLKKKKQQM